MTAQQLKNAILQLAVQGKLVPQDQNDEPASALLERIRKEKQKLIKTGKIKKDKNESVIYRASKEDGDGSANLPYTFLERTADGTVRDISDELPFDLPEGWEWVAISNICKTITAGGDKPIDFSETKTETKTVPVIANGETNKGIIGYTQQARVFDKSITVSGRGTIGYSCIRTEPYCPIVRLLVLILVEHVSFEYLQYVLDAMLEIGVGTSIPQLTVPMLAPKLIPLPPLTEQHRIVERIEELFPLIEAYGEKYDALEKLNITFPAQLKKSILQTAVQGKLVPQDPADEPASVLLERIRKEKQKLIKEGNIKRDKGEGVIVKRDKSYYEKQGETERCIDDQIAFDLPEGWEWVRLGSIIQLISGQDMTPDKYNANKQGVPYITGASNIENDSVLINRWTSEPKTIVMHGDLLITCKGTVGAMAFFNSKIGHIARQIMAIRMSKCLSHKYIKFFVETYVTILKDAARSMIPGISRNDVLNALVPLPPFAEQRRIVAKINALFQKCDKL